MILLLFLENNEFLVDVEKSFESCTLAIARLVASGT